MLIAGHTTVVPAMAFSPDGATLATGDMDGAIVLTDIATGAHRVLTRLTGALASLDFSPDGKRLASSAGRSVRVWDTESGLELLFEPAECVGGKERFGPDRKNLYGFRTKCCVWTAR